MAIVNTSLTSTAASVYTSQGDNAITTVIVCNTSTYNSSNPTQNQSLLYLYAVPHNGGGSVGTPGSGNIIVNGLPIPAGETVTFDQEKMVLSNNDSLWAKTDSASNLVVTVSTLAV